MQKYIKHSLGHAKERNREFMGINLGISREHGASAKLDAIEQRNSAAKAAFYGTNYAHKPPANDDSKYAPDLNNDELSIENDLSSEQVIANRVKEVESKSKVIHIS